MIGARPLRKPAMAGAETSGGTDVRRLQTNREADGASVAKPVHAEPKVGRNDPCPCGSGKKYKKCHGA
jgi:uncharacterized protein YchJ